MGPARRSGPSPTKRATGTTLTRQLTPETEKPLTGVCTPAQTSYTHLLQPRPGGRPPILSYPRDSEIWFRPTLAPTHVTSNPSPGVHSFSSPPRPRDPEMWFHPTLVPIRVTSNPFPCFPSFAFLPAQVTLNFGSAQHWFCIVSHRIPSSRVPSFTFSPVPLNFGSALCHIKSLPPGVLIICPPP